MADSTSIGGSQPVSVASSSSAGAAGGSVINVSSLVSQLVQATQAPQQNLINTQMASVTTQISNLGTLKSAISTFQQSLSALDTAASFNAQTASSSDESVFTATVTSGAPAGIYAVSVQQLAQGQQLLSGPLSTTLGTGTLSLSLGSSTPFSVTVDSTDNTPAGLAAAIDSASGNPGISATVIQGTNGPQLLLSSTQTGAANTISIQETDGGDALSSLTTDTAGAVTGTGSTATTGSYAVQTAAQDAEYTIAGVAATSASNTVSNAITGVTLALTGISAGSPAILSVATDTGTIEANVESFVQAYNTLQGTFTELGGYDSDSGTAGAMMGNPLLTGTEQQLGGVIHGLINTGSGTYNSLASLGITTNADGTLTLDPLKLSVAMSTDFSAVSKIFSGSNGVATQLNTQINSLLSTNGMFATSSSSLIKQENDLDNQTNTLQTQMTELQASLTQQYSALNTLLSSLQTTSSYLTQAFASLPQVQSSSS